MYDLQFINIDNISIIFNNFYIMQQMYATIN